MGNSKSIFRPYTNPKKIKKGRGKICQNCREWVPYYFKRELRVYVITGGTVMKTNDKYTYCKHCGSWVWNGDVEEENVRRFVRVFNQIKKERRMKDEQRF